ncbi:putative acetolactate synthase small subunit, partial [Smittium culicis]
MLKSVFGNLRTGSYKLASSARSGASANGGARFFAQSMRLRNIDDSALYQLNAEDTVTSLMRTTMSQQKPRVGEYVFNCFMQDEPGILARCTGIMAARGYNIDSLVVSKTEVE